jgi:hypothetical protein
MDQPTAVIIAAVFATVGWLYTNRSNRLLARRRHTFEMFRSYLADPQFILAVKNMGKMVRENRLPTDYRATDREEDIDNVMYLINHYEFVSAAIYNGDLDEKFIRAAEYSRMVRRIDLCMPFIVSIRDGRPQPTFSENLEQIVIRWRDEYPTNWDGIYEWFAMKPRRRWQSIASK